MLISKSDNHLTNLILKRPRPGCRKHILIHNGKSHFMSVLHLQITGKGIDSCKRTGLCMDISECGSVLHSVFSAFRLFRQQEGTYTVSEKHRIVNRHISENRPTGRRQVIIIRQSATIRDLIVFRIVPEVTNQFHNLNNAIFRRHTFLSCSL